MPSEIARLGLMVDTDGFVRADKVLSEFNKSAERAEKNAQALGDAANRAGADTRQGMERAEQAVHQVGREAQQAGKLIEWTGRQGERAGIEIDRAMDEADRSVHQVGKDADLTGRKLEEVGREGSEAGKAIQREMTGVADTMRTARNIAAALGLTFGAVKLGGLVKESAMLNSRFEQMNLVLEVVGRNAGFSAAEVNRYAQEVQAMGITMNESRQTVISMIQAQMDLSRASELARVAQDAAVIGNINSTEALGRLIHGIQAGQIEVLRGIGINVQFEQGYRALAEQLGKTTADLTDAERAQSRMNQVLEAGTQIAGAYTASMDSASKQLGSTARYVEDLKVLWGEVFSEANKQLVFGYSDALKGLLDTTLQMKADGSLKEWGEGVATGLRYMASAAELGAVVLVSRLTPAIWESTRAWVAKQAVAVSAAGALGTANAAMMAVGGPAGAALIASYGMWKFFDAIHTTNDELKDLHKTLGRMSREAMLDAMAQETKRLDELRGRYANLNKLVEDGIASPQAQKNWEDLGVQIAAAEKRLRDYESGLKRLADEEYEKWLTDMTEGTEWYTRALERQNKVQSEVVETQEDAVSTAADMLLALRQERAMLTMTAKEKQIYTYITGEGAKHTREMQAAIIAEIEALHEARDALAALADETEGTGDSITKLGSKSSEVSDAMIRDWQNVRQSFGEFFADLVIDGTNAFDALLKSWERTALQMAGNKLFDLGAQMMGMSIPGGTDSTSYGAFGSLLSAGAGRFLPGLTRQGAAITDAELQQLMGGKSTGVGGLNLTDLKGIGMNIGAGIAGSFAGDTLGEAIFGKSAESRWGASAGGLVGAYVGGPLGSFIGSAIGSAVDVAFGGDGKLRSNAGFLAAPTPGLKDEYNAGKHTFASGLEVSLFARRADASQAREILQVFDQVDRSFVDLVKQLGGSISVSQLTGLDEEANPGSYGAFFGVGGNGTTQGNVLQQVNSFIAQLTDHTSGLSDALLETIRSASSAEEVLAELTKAVAMETIQDKLDPLRAKTRAYEKDLEILQQVYAEGSDEYIDAARRLKEIHGLAKESADDFARALQGIRGIIDPLNDRISALTRQIRADLNMLRGIVTDDPLQQLQRLRDQAWDHHHEQMRAEEALHNRRLDLARSLTQYITDLRLGPMSPLSAQAQYELAQAEWRSTLAAALGGDVDAAGRLQSVAQTFAEQSQGMWASSSMHKANMDEILAGLEQAADVMGASKFDPQQANNRLVSELERINEQLGLLPGKFANELAGPMGMFIAQALAAGRPLENVANIVSSMGAPARAGAEAAMPGITSKGTSAADMRAFVEAQRAMYAGQQGGELLALQAIAERMRDKDISPSLAAEALGLSEAQLQRNMDKLKAAGIPGFASGGYHAGGWRVVGERGPELEFTGPSHIVSNQDSMRALSGAANDEMLAELRGLRDENAAIKQELAALRKDYRAGKAKELELEDQHRRVDEEAVGELRNLSARRAGGYIG